MLLDSIDSPQDLRELPESELPALAAEIRQEILRVVSSNGGHLASNLGAVELTIALHRVFDTPREPLIFDVGHQCYTHKLLTGRRGSFSALRRFGGPGGFPAPSEDPVHDPAVCGHAGAALAAAAGMAAVFAENKEKRKAVAIIGDGSLSNGGSLEALNSASENGGKNLIVVLNDNQMSISRNVGSLTGYLNHIITGTAYNHFKKAVRALVKPMPRLDKSCRHLKEVVKGALMPPGVFFETLGFHYFGPVKGHDLGELLPILRRIRNMEEGPILLHVVTEKGKGCSFAEKAPARYHGVPGFDLQTGQLPSGPGGFSAAFSRAMLDLGEAHNDVVAVSAAMLRGTGLTEFHSRWSSRCYDVGIAEGCAVSFAAGLAAAGKRPVCAFYATFLQRALDQLYHDVVLARHPVIFAVDRAGIVEDGPTHHGIYDLGFLQGMPGLTILAPAAEEDLAPMLEYAYSLKRPVVIRYPRGQGAKLPETCGKLPLEYGRARVIREGEGPVLWGAGAETGRALAVAELLALRGISCTVADFRFLKPLDEKMIRSFGGRMQFLLEDHVVSCGTGPAFSVCAAAAGSPVRVFGWPDEVIGHGSAAELRRAFHLSTEEIADEVQRVWEEERK